MLDDRPALVSVSVVSGFLFFSNWSKRHNNKNFNIVLHSSSTIDNDIIMIHGNHVCTAIISVQSINFFLFFFSRLSKHEVMSGS